MAVRSSQLFLSAPRQKTDGYIVIIVLLLTAVLLMLGLSLATRTTEEVYQSGQEADTTRVFNAAETGIERALFDLQSTPVTAGSLYNKSEALADAQISVTGNPVDSFAVTTDQGEVLTLKWNDDTKIEWKYAGCGNAAALIITLYDAGDSSAHHVAYNPVDSNGTACTGRGSSFDTASLISGGSSVTLSPALFRPGAVDPDSLLRIRPIYADATFTISGSSATEIISTASDTSGGGGATETRKIKVIRTEPAAPAIFDYAVFSGGSLTK